jgi:ribosomal protein S18 acetylase RimI-like enzyme
MEEYSLRTFEEGDEVELTRLFNEAYKGYAGFVPKTLEYWRWSCLDRPDVEKEGIIIVAYRGKIVAYAVIGKTGNIWELCFNQAHKGKDLVSLILENAVEYLIRVGADSATLNLPSEDTAVRETCEKLGFLEVPPDTMFLSVLDFEKFLQLLSCAKKEKMAGLDESFLIEFKDAPFWTNPYVSIRIENGRTKIEGQNTPSKVLIETDTTTLTSILFGTTKPLWALIRFRLKIYPLRKFHSVLKWFSLLRLDDSWFFPRSDLG